MQCTLLLSILLNMKSVELAWAAGFIDGEGSIVITQAKGRRTPVYMLQLNAGQAIREPLDRLVSILGGAVYAVSTRGTYLWAMRGNPAGEALGKIRPYVCCKSKEIDLALEFLETYKDRGRSTRAVPQKLLAKRENLRLAMVQHRDQKYALSRKVGGAAWRKWNEGR